MQLKLSEQIALGGCLGVALFSSIMQRSLSAGAGFVVIGLFLSVPLLANRGLLSSNKLVRRLAHGGLVLFLGALLVVFLTGIERGYLWQARSYPAWLATEHMASLDYPGALKLRAERCDKNAPLEIISKENGTVIRCGFNWLTAHTFLVDSYKGAF